MCAITRIRLLAVLLLLVAVPASAQIVLRVDREAPPGGDGSSWPLAYDELAPALAAAAEAPGPVAVWVAAGTYHPDERGFPQSDNTRSFELSAGLALLGGFAGDETAANERDPAANETVLSGDLWESDFPDWGHGPDNSFHVVTARDLAAPALIDGFLVIGGNADFDGSDLLGGGGIFVERSDLEVRDCRFTENAAGTTTPDVGNFGAALYVKGSGNVTIESCHFYHNRATNGGAVGMLERDDGVIDLQIRDTLFEDNHVPNMSAGALYFAGRSLTIENSDFLANMAGYGGAMVAILVDSIVLRDCDFVGNQGQSGAACLRLDRCGPWVGGPPMIVERCRFEGNSQEGSAGTALSLELTVADVRDCVFVGNSNLRYDPYDDDFDGVATIFVHGLTGHRFVNCLVADNFAALVPGAWLRAAQADFINCTFVGNLAAEPDPVAGGIHGYNSQFTVVNSVLWGNRYDTGEFGDLPGFGGEVAQISESGSVFSIQFCDVEGWTGMHGGPGNFGADPLFIDEAGLDLHVPVESPLVDSGWNPNVPVDLLMDLDGNPRIADGDGDESATVDIGVYELPATLVAVEETPSGPNGLRLSARREAGGLRIDYVLPKAAAVDLALFDVLGRHLRTLDTGRVLAGEHRLFWDGADRDGRRIASGIYFLRLAAGESALSRRVLLLR